MSRPRAADDFDTIRARMDELRRERDAGADSEERSADGGSGGGEVEKEQRRRARIAGSPPSWVPTIFVKKPRV